MVTVRLHQLIEAMILIRFTHLILPFMLALYSPEEISCIAYETLYLAELIWSLKPTKSSEYWRSSKGRVIAACTKEKNQLDLTKQITV